jgi:hypothetical protein
MIVAITVMMSLKLSFAQRCSVTPGSALGLFYELFCHKPEATHYRHAFCMVPNACSGSATIDVL